MSDFAAALSGRTAAEWLALVAAARRAGEYLEVIDLARRGLEEHPGDLLLTYDKILAYARTGATEEADANLRSLRDAGALDAISEAKLRTDFGALHARLLKDRAYAATGLDAAALARDAAVAYEAVFDDTGAYFPAVNAATLFRIAGDIGRSRRLAELTVAAARADRPGFWQGASIAEAELVLGDFAAAEAALLQAVTCGVHMDELATTRRQLAWLCEHMGIRAEWLAALPAPYVLCWETPAHAVDVPQEAIQSLVEGQLGGELPVVAYGAIVSPADIAVAETLIGAGVHTNLVIASTPEACIAAFGTDRGARLRAVLGAARSVAEVTLEGTSAEPIVASMAAQQARGLGAMRAAALVTRLHDVRIGPDGVSPVSAYRMDQPAPRTGQDRIARAFVFGDIKGFSTISEAAHRPFLDTVIGGFADVLDGLAGQVEYTETAGDGIYVVVRDVVTALRCCHGFQQAMAPGRLVAAGLPATLGLRLGAHVGPAARGQDRVTGREKFIGKEVIRTARIEAVTPVGATYVTEQFAATLHSLTPVGHACEYVGWQAMAKGFGRCRMYSLRPTAQILALLRDDGPHSQ